MINKLEHRIGEYFKLINSCKYDEVDIGTSLLEPMCLVIITIHVKTYEDSWPYHRTQGRTPSILSNIKDDMEDMFPYMFKVFCKVNPSL